MKIIFHPVLALQHIAQVCRENVDQFHFSIMELMTKLKKLKQEKQ